MISKKLRDAIRLSDRRAYIIAHEAGLHPSTLSRLINGIERVQTGDERVVKIGKVVGVPEKECFANE